MLTFNNLLFCIVYSTKYRGTTINSCWQDVLYARIGGIIDEQKGTCCLPEAWQITSIC